MANGSMEAVWEKISDIAENGCAKREADGIRISQLEKTVGELGKKLDRIFYTTLGTLATMCAFLIKFVLFGR